MQFTYSSIKHPDSLVRLLGSIHGYKSESPAPLGGAAVDYLKIVIFLGEKMGLFFICWH